MSQGLPDLPDTARARLAEIKASGTWGSALSTAEFTAIRSVGFRPVGQAFGAVVFNIKNVGSYGCPTYRVRVERWSAATPRHRQPVARTCVYHIARQRPGQAIGNVGRNIELEQVTQTLYDARERAMGRIQAAAQMLEAEGIVGMQLHQQMHAWGSHTTEFLAIGTAVGPLRDDHQITRPTMVLDLDH